MNNFKRLFVLTLLSVFVISAAACSKQAPDDPPAAVNEDNAPAAVNEDNLPTVINEDNTPEAINEESQPLDYHIGVVTLNYDSRPGYNDSLGYDNYEDEFKSAEAMVAQYGSVDKGGKIKHVILRDPYVDEDETFLRLANDPLIKAIIVNQGFTTTAAAFQKIRDAGRDDIILMTVKPRDDLTAISEVADVIVDADSFARGYYDILRAKNMGAKTFVFMSFPRHMSSEYFSRRRNIYEEACKDLGIQFAPVTVADVTSDLGIPGAQQYVYDKMPGLVERYGKDTAFFVTNNHLQEPLIERVAELGAMFVNQEGMSPRFGYPGALDLDLSAHYGDWWAMTQEIERAIVEKGQSGRMGIWPYSFLYCGSTGLVQLAMDMIEGKSTGNLENDLIAAYRAVTNDCEWMALPYIDADTGAEISNYYLMSMDTYILGQGYSGVFNEPVPEKYYSIKSSLKE